LKHTQIGVFLALSLIALFIIFAYLISKPSGLHKQESDSYKVDLVHLIEKRQRLSSICFQCKYKVDEKMKHCIICDECIPEFDHHCFWINRCIGKENLDMFYIFVCLLNINLTINLYISIKGKHFIIIVLASKNDYILNNFHEDQMKLLGVSFSFLFSKLIKQIFSYVMIIVCIAFLCPIMYYINNC